MIFDYCINRLDYELHFLTLFINILMLNFNEIFEIHIVDNKIYILLQLVYRDINWRTVIYITVFCASVQVKQSIHAKTCCDAYIDF